ncbi:iron-containing alcohol dehydrogenase [Pedomonas mirosovicensis]|uniref:iron-containing alcohol dehydrogenase n=1 Tax=Pedomonas mirosovicensis TaxID=2908641 RepID=UPI002169D0F5|nr:iron-containing alcohol dehydrogenase [Pedomonas mirosovicensis]MCH8684403.1 iron-containing alcohol dehydrogenase [Pedomonas mirosovicensis]
MPDFLFQTPANLRVGPGCAAEIGPILGGLGARRVLVVTDMGVVRAGLLDGVLPALGEAGIACTVFDGVLADPPVEVIEAAVEAGRSCKAEAVLGIGGGSPMDTAKLTAYLLGSGEQLEDIYGIGNAKGRRLPLVLAPTTAGTGSEVTPIAIVTTGQAEKKGVVSPALFADWAVLDADLTLGLPPHATAATGIDAMVHAIEAYTSRHKKNPLSDMLAREALRLLAGNIRAACADGENREARQAMLLGAMLAGQSFTNAPVAAVHALAYPIGGLFHVPHGVSNALMLPHVLRFNREAAESLYAELAPLVGAQGADGFIAAIEQLCDDVKVPRRLRDVGIGEEDVERLARDAMNQTRLLVNNPREVGLADARALYRAAF